MSQILLLQLLPLLGVSSAPRNRNRGMLRLALWTYDFPTCIPLPQITSSGFKLVAWKLAMVGMLIPRKSAYFANQGLKNLENGVLSIYQDTTDSRHSFTNIFLSEKGVNLSDSLNSELKSTICTVMKISSCLFKNFIWWSKFYSSQSECPHVHSLLHFQLILAHWFLRAVAFENM